MGPKSDSMAVVDPELKVRRTQILYDMDERRYYMKKMQHLYVKIASGIK